MKAITYHGAGDFRFESVADASIADPSDALVRVSRTAICGSDLHLWHGLPVADRGFAVGHELVGVVEDVGRDVRGVRRGDRVLVSCTVGCGRCGFCAEGLTSACRTTTDGGRSNVFGFSAALPGAQAEAVRVPFADANCFALPKHVDEDAAIFLTDVAPTGLLGAELAGVEPGDVVVVFGCGPVGSLAQRSAELRGAARVIAVDLDDARLARARARGYEALNPARDDVAGRVLALSGGRGADAVIEAVGRPELVQQALLLARPGGRIAAIGVIASGVDVAFPLLFLKSLSLSSGLVSPQRAIPVLLAWLEAGRLDPSDLVTHRLPLADGVRGYRLFDAHAEGALKVVLHP